MVQTTALQFILVYMKVKIICKEIMYFKCTYEHCEIWIKELPVHQQLLARHDIDQHFVQQ